MDLTVSPDRDRIELKCVTPGWHHRELLVEAENPYTLVTGSVREVFCVVRKEIHRRETQKGKTGFFLTHVEKW